MTDYISREAVVESLNTMTNADKIRAMTDEELLEFFRPNVIACQDCPAYAYCNQNYNPYTDLTVKCSDVIFAWLKQDVEEDCDA